MRRGRPPLVMTTRRRQVLRELADLALGGQKISKRELARRCEIHDVSTLNRVLRDLQRMGCVR